MELFNVTFPALSASLFEMKQNIAILGTKLLDLSFHSAFSRSNNQVAVFLLNGVINTKEDPEPDDENVVDEGRDNDIEFNEAQSATNTEIVERHLTSADQDDNNGDDVESDPFQLPFMENLEDEADPFSSVGVDSASNYDINNESNSNNHAIDHSFNEEENQNTISNDSLAVIAFTDQSNYSPQNLLLTIVEHNDLNVDNSTLENNCAFVENEKAI